MDWLSTQAREIFIKGEPAVIAALLCLVLSFGFILGKGLSKTHKTIHTKYKTFKAARTKDLLE